MIRVFTNRDAFFLISPKKSTTTMRRRRGGAQFTVVRAQKPPQVDRTTGFIESDNTVSVREKFPPVFAFYPLFSLGRKLEKREEKRRARSSRRRRTTTAFFWFVSKDVESIEREVVPLSLVSVPRISRSIGKR
jgi:hypothetical protein